MEIPYILTRPGAKAPAYATPGAAAADLSVLMEIVFPQAEKNCTMPTFLVNRKVDGLIKSDRSHVVL